MTLDDITGIVAGVAICCVIGWLVALAIDASK